MDIFEKAIVLHEELRGKISVENKLDIKSTDDLSLAYSPGVAAPCIKIFEDPSKVYDYTIKGNTVAIVSDGSAVLGLGNIGAKAAIPVMEGKAMLLSVLQESMGSRSVSKPRIRKKLFRLCAICHRSLVGLISKISHLPGVLRLKSAFRILASRYFMMTNMVLPLWCLLRC